MANAGIDQNSRATLTALSSTGDGSIVTLYANPVTHRLLVDLAGGTGTVTSVSGVTNRTTITGVATVNPTVDIASTYAGQASITTLGTIGTGVWNGTAIAAINGGTGQTVYAVGDLLYASTTTALSKLADIATGNSLISGGVGVAPSWGKIGLTTHVSGTLPVANGGTNAGAFTAGSIVFAGTSGTYTQDNANFFWDNTNKIMGIGTNTPTSSASTFLHVKGSSAGVSLESTSRKYSFFATSANFGFFDENASTYRVYILSTGEVGFGTITPSAKMHVISTTEQKRLGYDASNYFSTTVGSTGVTTFDAVGSGASFVFSDNVGIGVSAPTAILHLKAGTATAGTSPLKLVTGTALTTPEDGAIEYHSSHLYFTVGSTRYQLDQQGGTGANSLGTYIVQTATNAPANGQVLGSLSTGIIKNTTTTGVLSIAIAADFPTLNQNTIGTSAGLTGTPNISVGTVASSGVTVGGVAVPTISSTSILTNKRITKRVVVTTQSATPTINTDNTDISQITGLAQAITSMTSSLSGTPLAGDMLMIQITDNGTARAITWGASFASTTVALPLTTVASTMLRVLFQRNNANTIWDCISVV